MRDKIPMKKKEEQRIAKMYDERLEKLGKSAKTAGWRSEHQQEARFKVLSEVAQLDGTSMLDVGCGFGDLYDYLQKKGVKLKKYEGIDISPKMIEKARDIHKAEKNAAFKKGNLKELSKNYKEGSFDYVVESGIFNYSLSDNYDYLKKTLDMMFRLCRLGMAINMTTNYVDYKDKDLFYFSPEKVFSICKKIAKRVCLRHDYMPYEFTVYLYSDQTIDENNVFKEFSKSMNRKKSR